MVRPVWDVMGGGLPMEAGCGQRGEGIRVGISVEAKGRELVLLAVAPGCFCVCVGWGFTQKARGLWKRGGGRCGHAAGTGEGHRVAGRGLGSLGMSVGEEVSRVRRGGGRERTQAQLGGCGGHAFPETGGL